MAIDSRIALNINPLNIGQRFAQNLQNLQQQDLLNQRREQAPFQQKMLELNTELREAQQPANVLAAERAASPLTQQLLTQEQMQELDINNAKSLKPFLDSGDLTGAINQLNIQKQQAQQLGFSDDVNEADIAIQTLQAPDGLQKIKLGTDSFLQSSGVTPRAQAKTALKTFAPITDQSTGQVSLPTFDPNTGETKLVPIEGAVQETERQKQQRELKGFTTKEESKARLSRAKEIKKELGDRNRNAARSQQPLMEALRLASNPRTAEGLAAGVVTQLARVLPGIDASNESNLDSALNRLALEQLQNFKGPTTDFEFGVTQNIVGSLTDPREANIARLKSLQRANWFAKKEFKQFNDHMDSGGSPDEFAFNFNEEIKTKKGSFSLKDIQETAVDNRMTIEEVLAELDK
ncbi:MAG: hypothetical protein ACPGUE_12095 [Marinomonas sp.]